MNIEFEYLQNALKEEEVIQGEISTRVYTNERAISLQFCGWELVLLRDGTYFTNDTSGG